MFGRPRRGMRWMARPSRPWFRFYVEAVSDRKLRRLAPEHRWLFVACLAAARQSPVPGVLLVGEGDPMGLEDLADVAAMGVDNVRQGMEALCQAGVIRWSEQQWSVPAWADRQYESDVSTARVKKHRMEQDWNGETPFQKRFCNAPDTDTEQITELEARKRATQPTEAFEIDPELRAWAAEKHPSVDLDREREGWLLWCAANGRKYLSHRAGFQTWVRRAGEIQAPRVSAPVSSPPLTVLGRGVDAAPAWDLDETGRAVKTGSL